MKQKPPYTPAVLRRSRKLRSSRAEEHLSAPGVVCYTVGFGSNANWLADRLLQAPDWIRLGPWRDLARWYTGGETTAARVECVKYNFVEIGRSAVYWCLNRCNLVTLNQADCSVLLCCQQVRWSLRSRSASKIIRGCATTQRTCNRSLPAVLSSTIDTHDFGELPTTESNPEPRGCSHTPTILRWNPHRYCSPRRVSTKLESTEPHQHWPGMHSVESQSVIRSPEHALKRICIEPWASSSVSWAACTGNNCCSVSQSWSCVVQWSTAVFSGDNGQRSQEHLAQGRVSGTLKTHLRFSTTYRALRVHLRFSSTLTSPSYSSDILSADNSNHWIDRGRLWALRPGLGLCWVRERRHLLRHHGEVCTFNGLLTEFNWGGERTLHRLIDGVSPINPVDPASWRAESGTNVQRHLAQHMTASKLKERQETRQKRLDR